MELQKATSTSSSNPRVLQKPRAFEDSGMEQLLPGGSSTSAEPGKAARGGSSSGIGIPASVPAFRDDLMLFGNRARLSGPRHLLLVWAEQSRLHFPFTLPAAAAPRLKEPLNFSLTAASFYSLFPFFFSIPHLLLRPPGFCGVGQSSGEISPGAIQGWEKSLKKVLKKGLGSAQPFHVSWMDPLELLHPTSIH